LKRHRFGVYKTTGQPITESGIRPLLPLDFQFTRNRFAGRANAEYLRRERLRFRKVPYKAREILTRLQRAGFVVKRQSGSLDLRRRRGGEADEDDDAITTRIATKVDVHIRFPVVDGPDVASLIDDHGRLTHHWDETGRSAWTV